MPAVVVDSSVLITLAAGEQFDLLRQFYGSIHVPPAVWNEVVSANKPYGVKETRQARSDGWLVVETPTELQRIRALPFHLQPGEIEALTSTWFGTCVNPFALRTSAPFRMMLRSSISPIPVSLPSRGSMPEF